jgi:hypothetical protein
MKIAMATPILTEAQDHWARQFVGFWIQGQMVGQAGVVVSYEAGKRGNGVYFITVEGKRIYRRFPKGIGKGL